MNHPSKGSRDDRHVRTLRAPAASPAIMTDLTSLPPAIHPHDAAATDSVHAAAASITSARRPKDKVRSAWISFAGRIVAQLIGAGATVLLGVYVVSGFSSHARGSSAGATRTGAPGTPAVTSAQARPRRAPGALVVLPFADYSRAGADDRVADALTEGLTATLARQPQLAIVSRTSAMHYKGRVDPLPAIAAALDVDLVVEGSIVRQGSRLRATVQLIDAASDTHLWAQTYDRASDDLLALEADLASAIGADLLAALPWLSPGHTGSTAPASADAQPADDQARVGK
jgi:TolB-like protein